MWPKHPASVVIDSAMYMLTISWPDIENVAMSLYDIIYSCFTHGNLLLMVARPLASIATRLRWKSSEIVYVDLAMRPVELKPAPIVVR